MPKTSACSRKQPSTLCRLSLQLFLLLSLNGCAALAVSLAGAGAGAGLSHQMNGGASRTFSEPLDKVDSAVQIAARKMLLEVDEVASLENGQLTRARVSELDISLRLETLSGNLTRVDVVARKDFFRLDVATAQEIVTQVERALTDLNQAASEAAAEAARRSALNEAKYSAPASQPARKTSSSKRKNAI